MANDKAMIVHNDMTTEGMAVHLVKSGYFRDVNDPHKAVVKLLAGRELGMPPIASLMNVYIVDGKVTLSATMMGALIKKSERYDYTAKIADDCVVITFRDRATKEVLGESSFSLADAQKAGLKGKSNWEKYPKAMMFARALSQGARWYCPDIFAGAAYTPEEIAPDTTVNEDGAPTATVTVISSTPAATGTLSLPAAPSATSQHTAEPSGNAQGESVTQPGDEPPPALPPMSESTFNTICDLMLIVPPAQKTIEAWLSRAGVDDIRKIDEERGMLIVKSLKAKSEKKAASNG
jgi:hypothetical protein